LTGKEQVLHSFGAGDDGNAPYAGVIVVRTQLYGTTDTGGKLGFGTVYAMSF
jgi:hypothetical protein